MFGFGQDTGSTAVSQVVSLFISILVIAIFIRAILSWFNLDPRSPLIVALNQITEPILEPIRRFMPRLGIDLSPMIAIILLEFVQAAVVRQFG
ncbi:MAG TPA: YggT family protein [Dehalococcoidia bacterium]|jgi:YggT family protein|nr:YggT family protein [Dehalococcoidia bacterium]